MSARHVLLLVLSIVGLVAMPFVMLVAGVNLISEGGIDRARTWTLAGFVICALVLVWEVIELLVARRIAAAGTARVRAAIAITAITAVAYGIFRLILS